MKTAFFVKVEGFNVLNEIWCHVIPEIVHLRFPRKWLLKGFSSLYALI